MPISTSDFFKPIDLKCPPTNKDYSKAEGFVQAADAFSRATNHCVYIIDYYRRGFLYVSENPLFLCGKTPQCVLQSGYLFYLNHVPKPDLELLLKINEAGFQFFSGIPAGNRGEYSITYDFHLIHRNKKPVLVNHHLTPLALDEQSNIWLALCLVTHSSNKLAGNIQITRKGSSEVFEYDLDAKTWNEQKATKLTVKEREVLILAMKGFTTKEIAQKMGVTVVTIKFHRKNILQKFGVNNISEAVSHAANYNVL